MQKLCLELCRELGIHESTDEMEPLNAEPNDLKIHCGIRQMIYTTIIQQF